MDEARALLAEVRSLCDDPATPFVLEAAIAFKDKQLSVCVDLLQRAYAQTRAPVIGMSLAQVYLADNQIEQAAQLLDGLNKGQYDVDLTAALCKLYANVRGDFTSAIRVLEECAQFHLSKVSSCLVLSFASAHFYTIPTES